MRIFFLLFLSLIIISCSEKNTKPKFETEAYATLEINLYGHLDDSIEVTITHNSIMPDESKRVKQLLSTNSEFIHIEIDRASNADLTLKNKNYRIWLSPNDTTTINLSKSSEIESFSGKFEKENEYFLAKKKELGFISIVEPFNQILMKQRTYNDIKHIADSLSTIEMNHIQKYEKNIPEKFKDYEENQISYTSAVLQAQFPLYNQAMNIIEDPLPENFYDFVEELKLNNINAIPTISYYGFLTNYFWKDVDQDIMKTLSGKERSIYLKNHLYFDANEFLEPAIRDYFLTYHLTDMIKLFDKDELDSISSKWDIKINKDLIQEIINQKLTSTDVYKEGSKVEDFEMLNEKGETVRISDFKNKIVYLNFWGTWCKPCIANIPDLNKFIKSYQESEDVIFLNVAIRSNEGDWKKSIQKFDLKGLNLFIPKGEIHDKVRSKFGATGVPHYAILGKENILKVNYANKAPKVKTELETLLKVNN